MEASGQTGPAESTGSMPEGEVSGAMTAPVARQHQLYQRDPIRPQLLSLRHLWTHQDWQIIFLIL